MAEIATTELDKPAVGSATAGKEDILAALFDENFYAMDGGSAIRETGLEHLTVEMNLVLTMCRVQGERVEEQHRAIVEGENATSETRSGDYRSSQRATLDSEGEVCNGNPVPRMALGGAQRA